MAKILHHVASLPRPGPRHHKSSNIKQGVEGFYRLVGSGAGFIPSTDSAVTARRKKSRVQLLLTDSAVTARRKKQSSVAPEAVLGAHAKEVRHCAAGQSRMKTWKPCKHGQDRERCGSAQHAQSRRKTCMPCKQEQERESESVRSQQVRDDRERDGRRARAWRVRCAAVCVYGRSCVVSSP